MSLLCSEISQNDKSTKGRQRQDSERVYEETMNRVLSGEMDDLIYSTEIPYRQPYKCKKNRGSGLGFSYGISFLPWN